MADQTHFLESSTWTVTADFGSVNPTTVTATAFKPNGSTETYTYPSGNWTNPEPGTFVLADTADVIGDWYVEVVGTGAAAGRARHAFVVDPQLPADLLNPDALTTIERVELVLDRSGVTGSSADDEQDMRLIAEYINSFSAAVHNHTGRQFKPTEDDVAKIFDYDGNGILSFVPTEIRDITSVVAFTDRAVGQQETWTPGDTGSDENYWPFPRNRTGEGTYLYLEVPRVAEYRYSYWRHGNETYRVTVTGDWGAGVVPSDVEYVVASEAANAYVRATSRVVSLEGQLLNDVGAFALSNRSRDLLEPYSNRGLMIA
jgi:hypothetical protein